MRQTILAGQTYISIYFDDELARLVERLSRPWTDERRADRGDAALFGCDVALRGAAVGCQLYRQRIVRSHRDCRVVRVEPRPQPGNGGIYRRRLPHPWV